MNICASHGVDAQLGTFLGRTNRAGPSADQQLGSVRDFQLAPSFIAKRDEQTHVSPLTLRAVDALR